MLQPSGRIRAIDLEKAYAAFAKASGAEGSGTGHGGGVAGIGQQPRRGRPVYQEFRQEQRLEQRQVLSPQMQQSLHLLQAPILELQALVQQELQMNPTLEEVAPIQESIEVHLDTGAENGARESGPADGELDFREEFSRLQELDREWREIFDQTQTFRATPEDEERRARMLESIVEEESLEEHLLGQLRLADLAEAETRIGELIIGSIDENGYLRTGLDELASMLGAPLDQVERVLRAVQGFDPAGIAARDLRECLLLQLEHRGYAADSLEMQLVRDHLEQLGRKRFPELARRFRTDPARIQQVAELLATLDPRPARRFAPAQNPYVLPDVEVVKLNGQWTVRMNDDYVPHLRISNLYRRMMAERGNDPEVIRYIREKVRAGQFLIRSIHQRQDTIRRIAEEMVRRQEGFFEHGVSELRPMTMAQIAEVIGVHETTVSRAIANKYLRSPRGVFELRFFFSSGYQTRDGKSLSNRTVKDAVAELVAGEDPTSPLSDQAIVAILEEQGLDIARRTVAKYRGELGILPSHMRRQY